MLGCFRRDLPSLANLLIWNAMRHARLIPPSVLPTRFCPVLFAHFVVIQKCALFCEGFVYFGTEFADEVRGLRR